MKVIMNDENDTDIKNKSLIIKTIKERIKEEESLKDEEKHILSEIVDVKIDGYKLLASLKKDAEEEQKEYLKKIYYYLEDVLVYQTEIKIKQAMIRNENNIILYNGRKSSAEYNLLTNGYDGSMAIYMKLLELYPEPFVITCNYNKQPFDDSFVICISWTDKSNNTKPNVKNRFCKIFEYILS